ncbi:MAG: hypothetical protein K2Y21_02195 [Phycisphaerales bacterium]|nr:hypothetical protein [Phycisphaerales bacterium]
MKSNRSIRPMAPRGLFLRHLAAGSLLASVLIGASLAIGTLGYHQLENLPWIDSFLNASMILSGMGPVDRLTTNAGKLFASIYALFAGIVFLSSAALIFTPVLRRTMHRLHLDMYEEA